MNIVKDGLNYEKNLVLIGLNCILEYNKQA